MHIDGDRLLHRSGGNGRRRNADVHGGGGCGERRQGNARREEPGSHAFFKRRTASRAFPTVRFASLRSGAAAFSRDTAPRATKRRSSAPLASFESVVCIARSILNENSAGLKPSC